MHSEGQQLEWMGPPMNGQWTGPTTMIDVREEDVHDLSTAAFLFGRESAAFDRISKRLIQAAMDRWCMEALEHGLEEADRRQAARAAAAQAAIDAEDDAVLGPCAWCGQLPSAHIDGTRCPTGPAESTKGES